MAYFGTDGVRGLANEILTSDISYRIGRFIGQYPEGKKNRILVGRDTRISGDMLNAALVSGLTRSGADVYDLGITTTPSISYLVESKGFDFGIMISASHNPFYDNGIKVFGPNGEKLTHDIELQIEDYIDAPTDYLPSPLNKDIGRVINSKDLIDDYLDFLASKSKDLTNMHIVMDCAHGSASVVARELFSNLLYINAEYINDSYDGIDINLRSGSTHLEQIIEKVKEGKYDLGLAFDGDADRLIVISDKGEVIDGDSIMYIAARYLKKHELLKDNTIVLTTMSNLGLKLALKKAGINYFEVDVGDKNVQAKLKEKGLVLGGEQSGHIIFYDKLNTGDGLLSAIEVMNVIASEHKSITQLVEELKIFPQVLKNVVVSNKKAIMENDELINLIARIEDELGDNGRILVRPSGTEQLIRVMVEAPSSEICEKYVDEVIGLIEELSF
jgi:phosphoglucosamine mutase